MFVAQVYGHLKKTLGVSETRANLVLPPPPQINPTSNAYEKEHKYSEGEERHGAHGSPSSKENLSFPCAEGRWLGSRVASDLTNVLADSNWLREQEPKFKKAAKWFFNTVSYLQPLASALSIFLGLKG